uniref:Tudor domain-containing protein n=1 Tax=Setaria digitata TaxID=48799 RepID=A0A915PXV3_9BILA
MSDVQKEIQNLWREMVSEMNYAVKLTTQYMDSDSSSKKINLQLSDDCMKELQAQNVLKTRYHKFRLSLQGTIDAIKEFTKSDQSLVELPPNPFDVENLPKISSTEPSLQKTWKLTQHINKDSANVVSLSVSDRKLSHHLKNSNSSGQKINCSVSLYSEDDSIDSNRWDDNNVGSSMCSQSDTFVVSKNKKNEERLELHNPFKYSDFSSTVSGHILTCACLSPAEGPFVDGNRNLDKCLDDFELCRSSITPQHFGQAQERGQMLNSNPNDEETNICGEQSFFNKINVHSDTECLKGSVSRCKFKNSHFSNIVNNPERSSSRRDKKITYPVENVFKTSEPFEQQGQSEIMVVPSPDLTDDSSDDDDEFEQQQFNSKANNDRSFYREMNSLPIPKSDPSSMYAKSCDLVSHKAPSCKQLVNVKITWIASQRDFYVTLINEQRRYCLLEQDVEEGEPCMVFKNEQFYRAVLESSVKNMCHVFLVDFGGYLMISKKEIAPMLRFHAKLPMAAIHCAILGAFQVKLTAETVEAFKRRFPIDSTFKLLFVRKSRYDDVYETQLYLRENMRHDAFLPLDACFM